jgi:hypothetical protein
MSLLLFSNIPSIISILPPSSTDIPPFLEFTMVFFDEYTCLEIWRFGWMIEHRTKEERKGSEKVEKLNTYENSSTEKNTYLQI